MKNNFFIFTEKTKEIDLERFHICTWEFDSFKKYLGDNRVKKDELVVVFNKKKNQDSYAFFSIFSKERIGAGQFALAVLVNLICGILLFITSFRQNLEPSEAFWKNLPIEVYSSIFIGLLIVNYFIWPGVNYFIQLLASYIRKKFSKK